MQINRTFTRIGNRTRVFIIIMAFICNLVFAEDGEIVPFETVFNELGWNALHAVSHNYGLNFAVAGLGTWAFIETGLDWKWRNLAYQNEVIYSFGLPCVYIGYGVPAIAPLATYITGRLIKNRSLQLTGLALTQTLVLTLGIQSVLKMTTGRALPGIVNAFEHTRNARTDDFSAEFDWFNMNFIGGWPSGHTANAFSAAATIAEIYKDKLWVKISVYSYALLMGLGMSLSVHWASEVFTGALIGYAIGKTVGRSFRKLLENDGRNNKLTFYAAYNGAGIIIRF